MKNSVLIVFLLIPFCIIAQNKKEMAAEIDSLKNENTVIKLSIKDTQKAISLLSDRIDSLNQYNKQLEEKIKKQEIKLQEINGRNDSLLIVLENQKLNTAINTEEDSIEYILINYLSCKKPKDRLNYILKPNENAAKLKKYYTDRYISMNIEPEDINIQGSNFKLNQIFNVLFQDKKMRTRTYYFKKTDEGYKIDWEASAGYNEVSAPLFMSKKSSTPTKFRAVLYLSEHFGLCGLNSNYSTYSFQTFDGGSDYVYIQNSHPDAKKINNILADGRSHHLIVELAYKKVNYGSSGTCELIFVTKFIQEGWSTE